MQPLNSRAKSMRSGSMTYMPEAPSTRALHQHLPAAATEAANRTKNEPFEFSNRDAGSPVLVVAAASDPVGAKRRRIARAGDADLSRFRKADRRTRRQDRGAAPPLRRRRHQHRRRSRQAAAEGGPAAAADLRQAQRVA